MCHELKTNLQTREPEDVKPLGGSSAPPPLGAGAGAGATSPLPSTVLTEQVMGT